MNLHAYPGHGAAAMPALVGAVLVPRCIDAEEVFSRLVHILLAEGVRLGGVLQVNVQRPGRGRCDMLLKDLASGRVVAISEDRGPEACGCRLDRAALAEASECVAGSIRQGVDLVIINKFGKAESEGGGMRQVIALALEYETPVLICANAEHHPNLVAFAGELATILPLTASEIEGWARSVIGRSPSLAQSTGRLRAAG